MAQKWYKPLTKPVREVRARLEERKWKPVEKRFGSENPDRTFYVIRSRFDTWGLIACYNHVLGHIKLAMEQGMIPVVDMKHYPNTYLDPEKAGKENSWEYYFHQPTEHTLEEAYRSRHVFLMDGMPPKEAHPRGQGKLYLEQEKNQEEIACNTRIIREHMRLRDDVKAHIREQYDALFPRGEKVLGVLCRGTDISLRRPAGHSVMPEPEEMIRRAGVLMEEWGCTRLFLTTEQEEAVELFGRAFGERVFYTRCVRYGNTGDHLLADIQFDRENDRYLRGLEYLTNIVLLSRCDCLLGVYVGGTVGALEMNGGAYEHVEMMDLGVY